MACRHREASLPVSPAAPIGAALRGLAVLRRERAGRTIGGGDKHGETIGSGDAGARSARCTRMRLPAALPNGLALPGPIIYNVTSADRPITAPRGACRTG